MGVVVPFVEGSKSIKDLIISLLATSPPLTIKKIHSQLRKKYSVGVTYQAVHKAVATLIVQGAVSRRHKLYMIHPDWVTRLTNFVQALKKNTTKYSGIVESKQEGPVQILTFASLEKAQEFKKELQKEFFEQHHATPPVYAGEDRHLISPLIHSERSLRLLNSIRAVNGKVFLAVRGNTAIDTWCADYYRNDNILVKTGVQCAEKCDVFVIGDRIVQIYAPEEIQKKLDEIYASARKTSDIKIPEIYEKVYKKKAKVRVVITQNPELAEQVRKQIVDYFTRHE